METTNEQAMECLRTLTGLFEQSFDEPPEAEDLRYWGIFSATAWNAVVLLRATDDLGPMMSLYDGVKAEAEPTSQFLMIMLDRIAKQIVTEFPDARWLFSDVHIGWEGQKPALRATVVSLDEWLKSGKVLSAALRE